MHLPILLAHGVCRFDALWHPHTDNRDDRGGDRLHYFRGVRTALTAAGFDAHHASVPWAAPVRDRAAALRTEVQSVLQQTGAPRLHLIAHSMGGLDARHMLFHDRNLGAAAIGSQVASLTAIGTPHRGSPLADWGLHHLPQVTRLASKLGLDVGAFEDLTTAACCRFDDDPEVRAFEQDLMGRGTVLRSHAGAQPWRAIAGVLKPTWRIVHAAEGANDGLVSVASARWRDAMFQGTMDADHLNQMGWWDAWQWFRGESPWAMRRRIHAFYVQEAKVVSAAARG